MKLSRQEILLEFILINIASLVGSFVICAVDHSLNMTIYLGGIMASLITFVIRIIEINETI